MVKKADSPFKNLKEGSLHKQLGIPEKDDIPKSLLNKIKNTDVGKKITYKGKTIPVTTLLKRRVQFALNFSGK